MHIASVNGCQWKRPIGRGKMILALKDKKKIKKMF